MLRILHTSDWHLGCPFSRFRARERIRLTEARFAALRNLLVEAHRQQVHAVLCAGDLFDDSNPRKEVWQRLAHILSEHGTGCPVVLLPGNHDPLVDGSMWQPDSPLRARLPEHVHVVDRDDFRLELAEGAQLYAVPLRARKSAQDPVTKIPAREEGDTSIRIGLVHGQTFQIGDQGAAHPVGLDLAEKRGLDYLALGDTHGFREIEGTGSAKVVYSGTHETTNFGEVDSGHVALVSFRRRSRRATVRKVQVGTLRWSSEALESKEEVDRFLARAHDQSVLSLDVSGRYAPDDYAAVEERLDELEGTDEVEGLSAACRVTRRLEMSTENMAELLIDAPEELQKAAALLEERRGTVEPEVVERAMAQLLQIAREVSR